MDPQDFVVEFEVEHPTKPDTFVLIRAEGVAFYKSDPAYGEDADGNRGQQQVLLDDFQVNEIKELVTGLPRYDLIADEYVIQSIEERLLEDGPENN